MKKTKKIILLLSFILVFSSCTKKVDTKNENLDTKKTKEQATIKDDKEKENKEIEPKEEKEDEKLNKKQDEKKEDIKEEVEDEKEEFSSSQTSIYSNNPEFKSILKDLLKEDEEIVWIIEKKFRFQIDESEEEENKNEAISFLGKKSDLDDDLYEGRLVYIEKSKASEVYSPEKFKLYKDEKNNRIIEFHDGYVGAFRTYHENENLDVLVEFREDGAILSEYSKLGSLSMIEGHAYISIKRYDAVISEGVNSGISIRPLFISYYGDKIRTVPLEKISIEDFKKIDGGEKALADIVSKFEINNKTVEISDIFFREFPSQLTEDTGLITVNFTVTENGKKPEYDSSNYYINFRRDRNKKIKVLKSTETAPNHGKGKYLENELEIE